MLCLYRYSLLKGDHMRKCSSSKLQHINRGWFYYFVYFFICCNSCALIHDGFVCCFAVKTVIYRGSSNLFPVDFSRPSGLIILYTSIKSLSRKVYCRSLPAPVLLTAWPKIWPLKLKEQINKKILSKRTHLQPNFCCIFPETEKGQLYVLYSANIFEV